MPEVQIPWVKYRVPWRERFRVWRSNWKCRHVSKAIETLSKALKDDPSYARAWHANIAMPIYDASRQLDHCPPLPASVSNAMADRLMKHLFNVDVKR